MGWYGVGPLGVGKGEGSGGVWGVGRGWGGGGGAVLSRWSERSPSPRGSYNSLTRVTGWLQVGRLSRPDMTFTVDWALKSHYLLFYLSVGRASDSAGPKNPRFEPRQESKKNIGRKGDRNEYFLNSSIQEVYSPNVKSHQEFHLVLPFTPSLITVVCVVTSACDCLSSSSLLSSSCCSFSIRLC